RGEDFRTAARLLGETSARAGVRPLLVDCRPEAMGTAGLLSSRTANLDVLIGGAGELPPRNDPRYVEAVAALIRARRPVYDRLLVVAQPLDAEPDAVRLAMIQEIDALFLVAREGRT